MAKSHLYLLYRETLRKYRKFNSRLGRKLRNGSFQQLTAREKRKFISRVEKLKRRLDQLRFQLKVAAAAGGLALTLSFADVQGQTTIGPFVSQPDNNPLRPPLVQSYDTSPTFGDLDGDGDLDMVWGTENGDLRWARNEGDVNNPKFTEQPNTTLPFNISFNNEPHPELGDFDGDGDVDLVVAEETGGTMRYFRNDAGTFVEGTGPWDGVAKTGNPLDGINTGYNNYKVTLVDYDGDGDLDLFRADDKYYGFNDQVKYYRNTGDGTLVQETGAWNPGTQTGNPLNGASSNLYFAGIGFADVDGDGDIDAVLGSDGYDSSPSFRPLITYLNTGDGTLNLATPTQNPFDGFTVTRSLDPTFADLNGDGNDDAIVGYNPRTMEIRDTESSILYFENEGAGTFTQLRYLDSPFGGVDSDHDATISFGDIDGDLDVDAFVGGKQGIIFFYENQGDNTFSRKIGADNPLDFVNLPASPAYAKLAVALADVDGDNLLDMHVGDNNAGNIKFYKNNGSGFDADVPTNSLNQAVIGSIYAQGDFKPALVDFDDDGDLDAFVGQDYSGPYGNTLFIRNNDTSPGKTNPTFAEDNTANPFQGMNFGTSNTHPRPVDINHDGDIDFFFGIQNGTFVYYENVVGTQTLRAGIDNPFDGVDVGANSSPEFADYDNDGDLDFFAGEDNGQIHFYENQNVPPTKTIGKPDLTFNPGGGALPLDLTFSATDDDMYAISARIAITSGFVSGDDELIFSGQSGITGVYNSSTGVLDLSGHASLANYILAIQSVEYNNSNNSPTGNRTIEITMVDQDATIDTNPVSKTITIPVPQPPVVTASAGVQNYTEATGPVAIDNAVTVTDSDGLSLVGATVSITANYVVGEDLLGFTDQNGITGSFDGPTGVLNLTGIAAVSDYEAALQSVTYENTSSNPSLLDRDITFIADDGTNPSTPAVKTLSITAVNDLPLLTPSVSSIPYTENQGPVVIDAGLTISDTDDGNLESATVTVGTSHVPGEDVLAFTNQLGITGNFDAPSGVLALSGTATIADYQTALRTVTYENIGDNPGAINKDLDFIVNDGTGSSLQTTVDVNITPVNDAPVLAGSGLNLVYNPGDGQVAIDPAITANDLDNTNLNGGTITIGNYQQGEDLLSLPTQSGITGVFDTNTGIMTLSGSATVADYQTALQQVAFENTNSVPTVLSRTIAFEVTDGTDASNQFVRTVNINFQNTAPVITPPQLQVKQGDPVTLDLSTIVSDPEGNLDLSTASIVNQPTSGAVASISGTNLTVDYFGLSFFGLDELDIEICDLLGACTVETISILVEPEAITVYNALSPNGDQQHDILEIANILDFPNNTVTIFNRWGDQVFEITGYNNTDRSFVGISDSGNELPAGTYYYSVIPGDGSEPVTGFFVISR